MCIQLAENGDCDEPCNTPGCSFDGGDCADPDDGPDWRECLADSSCTREWLGDGFCDPSCNTPECEQDDGDCDQCRDCPEEWLGDGTCDPQCNTEACDHDDGDCELAWHWRFRMWYISPIALLLMVMICARTRRRSLARRSALAARERQQRQQRQSSRGVAMGEIRPSYSTSVVQGVPTAVASSRSSGVAAARADVPIAVGVPVSSPAVPAAALASSSRASGVSTGAGVVVATRVSGPDHPMSI